MKSMPIMKGCSTSGTLPGGGEQQEELGLGTRHPNKAVKGDSAVPVATAGVGSSGTAGAVGGSRCTALGSCGAARSGP